MRKRENAILPFFMRSIRVYYLCSMVYGEEIERAKSEKSNFKKQVAKLKKVNHRKLDDAFHSEHEEAFSDIDCLKCANCCKTTSPIFRDVDIRRIARRLRMTEHRFIDTYLYLDNDQDYVLRQSPCAFLEQDNTCSIYEDRPLACREYPHTNRKNMYQILDLTRKNSEICPAVVRILDRIAEDLK